MLPLVRLSAAPVDGVRLDESMNRRMTRRGQRGRRRVKVCCEGETAWGDGGGGASADTARPDGVRLTGRERWIVSELVKQRGAPNKVIANALNISPNTLRNHLASIYAKVGVRRRVELVLYAMENGLDAGRDATSVGARKTALGPSSPE